MGNSICDNLQQKDVKMTSVDYTIGGVKVQFPCKAYPSQLAMMNSILRGLNNSQHCLLESPTGSGKSLALLCSALGWQRAQLDKMRGGGGKCEEDSSKRCSDDKRSKMMETCDCVCHCKVPASSNATPDVIDLTESPCKDINLPAPSPAVPRKKWADISHLHITADQDDFQPKKKRIRTAEQKGVVFIEETPQLESSQSLPVTPKSHSADLLSSCSVSTSPECCQCPCAAAKGKVKDGDGTKKVPKIFFGTRTHKQITQVAHELRRSAYCTTPMTILSSREHTCVNAQVAPHPHRNELCKELREAKDGKSCRYHHAVKKMSHQSDLQSHGLQKAWDIEDLVSLGKRLRACPYYAARELMQSSHIIFCPYNYLLDPMIRESMSIDLAGHILVLDEGHNIEDCARESGSFILDHKTLLLCRDELDVMVSRKIRVLEHVPLRDFCCAMDNWIQSSQDLLVDRGYEHASKVWSGKDVLGLFHSRGITVDTFRILQKHLIAVLEKEEVEVSLDGTEDRVQCSTISSSAATVLKGLFMVLDFLYRDNCRYCEDYRVALQKNYAWTNKAPPTTQDVSGFMNIPSHKQRKKIKVKTEVVTVSFWCLNPAVAFSDLSGKVHSIVLTSGTLSPMSSFSSELGVKFSIQLEASHVINRSQVWVGTVGEGPQGRKLCATFQHAETFIFQDEVGALLLHVCQVVSKGVLCFFPSYKMLDKMRDRWITTGAWEKLEQLKTVITEPRGGGKGDFDELLQIYYSAIKCSEERDGALLMAVCRGKVSEGLDFTDDNARAVVTIGIPFPNIKDLQVELKMKYNDQHCKSRGLLPGRHWYEIQAYRALNQALGRCIRHRKDWGALILVDDRYRSNPSKYITGLSKWVRQLVQHHDSFPGAMQSLAAFSQAQHRWSCVDHHTSPENCSGTKELPKFSDLHGPPHTPVPAEQEAPDMLSPPEKTLLLASAEEAPLDLCPLTSHPNHHSLEDHTLFCTPELFEEQAECEGPSLALGSQQSEGLRGPQLVQRTPSADDSLKEEDQECEEEELLVRKKIRNVRRKNFL
ncbi:Fanconi anemia group J protein isoform X1 [Nerophis lumbriciformis]|uniref:Fanconi anemia group J protein isoform X1 n=1 Tax=Nerophis lumbriciformis TaxID=546530 RepID=UPI002AE06BA7|nr:Fanconi anemia group J protein isoform X1 [Nerophis lumbriciformis]